MENVTVKKLESKFPGEGEQRFREIAEIGGFGAVSPAGVGNEGAIDMDFPGGLDIKGVLDPDNKALTPTQKGKIRELVGLNQDEGMAASAPTEKKKEK